MKSNNKANCHYVDDSARVIQVFAYKIWIDNTSKHIYKNDKIIYSLPEGDEVFSEFVFGHKCIYGIT